MPDLYLFYVGGNAGKSNIEVHDIQFVVAESVEAAIPHLQAAWFGDADKLHLDGYQIVRWVGGYDVQLSPERSTAPQKLYFVNVGGYSPDTLAELHDFGLFVAPNAAAAKQQALATLLVGAVEQHKDNLKEVDNQLHLDKLQGYHIHLQSNPDGQPDRIQWQGYRPIGVTDRQ